MTVGELRSRMTAMELDFWRAFSMIEPIGGERLDYLTAQRNATTAAAAGVKNPRTGDFVPDWWNENRPTGMSFEDTMKYMINMVESMGGVVTYSD